MWNRLESFMRNDIWERKDLWEKFNFKLDKKQQKYLSDSLASSYADTDSTFKNSLLKIKLNNENFKNDLTIEDFYNLCKKDFGIFKTTTSGQEMVYGGDTKVLNWTEENGLHYVPVKYVMRHKVRKPRYKIRTKSGKEIIVTGDHSCIGFRNGEQMTVKAKDINLKTDKVLTIN